VAANPDLGCFYYVDLLFWNPDHPRVPEVSV
jgi:hypothetical protein